MKAGQKVKIFTARVDGNTSDFSDVSDTDYVKRFIRAWCLEHIGYELEITNIKDYAMTELWDDRAIGVAPNEGIPIHSSNSKADDLIRKINKYRHMKDWDIFEEDIFIEVDDFCRENY